MNNYSQKLSAGICFFLFFVAQIAWAGEETDRSIQFQNSSSVYSRGDYKTAIQGFETLIQEGISAPLLYNLANSYAQDGQSGRAILNYERALRLAPGDSDIRGNLELVRKKEGLFQEEQSFGQRFVSLLGLNQWTGLAAIGFVLCGVALLLPPPIALKRTPRFVVSTVCLFVTAAAVFGAAFQYQHWHDGVVVANDARLRVSPFISAASIGAIQEGRLVSPGKMHNNFFMVKDETGRSGWLKADAFESIANF